MRSFKKRLMSAVLATAELANVGMTSYAVMPSDSGVASEEPEEEKVRVIRVSEMEGLPVNDLFEYLKEGSTDDELRLYYQNGTLDKTRQDVENFNSLSVEKKNELFEYVAELAYGDELEGFTELPMEIRTGFFEFILKENYELEPILSVLLEDKGGIGSKDLMEFVNAMCDTATPRVAGLMFGKFIVATFEELVALLREASNAGFDAELTFGKLNKGENLALDAIANYDIEALMEVSARPDFACNKEVMSSWQLIDYAALIGNVEAFKFLMLNNAAITEETKKYALIGENVEIIHLLEQVDGGYSTVLDNADVLRRLISAGRKDILVWLQTHFGEIKKGDIFISWCEIGTLPFLIEWLREICPEEMFNEAMEKEGTNLKEEMIKLFLSNGVDVNAGDKDGRTALTRAVTGNNVELAQILLANGAEIDVKDNDGRTALMLVAQEGQAETVQFLLERGADVNAVDKNGITALMYAVGAENEETVSLLLQSGVDVSVATNTGTTALSVVAAKGNTEMAEILLANGVDVNAAQSSEWTALMYAAQAGKTEMVQFLLEHGADVNAANKNEWTALMIAANKGHADVTEVLLANGADVNAVDKEGKTALLLAAAKGNIELAEKLLANGADVNAVDEYGMTALLCCANAFEDIETVKFFLQNGADVNAANIEGTTVLMCAAEYEDVEMVRFFLQNGADVNAVDKDGKTALILAAEKGNSDLIELLKANGAQR